MATAMTTRCFCVYAGEYMAYPKRNKPCMFIARACPLTLHL